MAFTIEAARAERERASKLSLGGDSLEDTAPITFLQAAWIASRFDIGASHARVIAEHAFARRAAR